MFDRTIALPTSVIANKVDKSKVDAKYHNGVLTVSIAKTKEGRGQRSRKRRGASTGVTPGRC